MQHGNEFKFFDFSKDEEILEKVKKDLAKNCQINVHHIYKAYFENVKLSFVHAVK